MQPNNPNPYYPPREPVAPTVPVTNPGQPSFSGLPKSGPAWGWIIAVAVLVMVLLGVGFFAIWAASERQDYKNNSDKKAAAAVEVAKKEQIAKDDKRFAEEMKNPLKTYVGPASYGSVSVQYPKTWSGYVTTTSSSSSAVLDAYFHPDIVPGVSSSSSSNIRPAVALRVQVLNQAYDQVVTKYKSYIDAGTLRASPYALPKMPEQIGTIFVGKLTEQLNGTEIVIPLRDKTLVISTDTDQYLSDINTYVLPNLSFEP